MKSQRQILGEVEKNSFTVFQAEGDTVHPRAVHPSLEGVVRGCAAMAQRRCAQAWTFSDWLVVKELGVSIINLLVPTGVGSVCVWAGDGQLLLHGRDGARGAFGICKTASRYCCASSLRRNQNPAPRLHSFF